jgi:hypothetical protein
MAQHSKAAIARRAKKKHGFNPPWLKAGKEPDGSADPVPASVRAALAKKYGHGKPKKKVKK